MTRLYYIAPSDEVFTDLKQACISEWQKHDNSYGYVDEKVIQIKDLKNVSDNFMYMLAMFDIHGQRSVGNAIGEITRKELRDRMIDGGNPPEFIPF